MKDKVFVYFEKCTGEAHQTGNMADHCMVCQPYWGSWPVCPVCKSIPAKKVHKWDWGTNKTEYWYWCKTCRKHLYENVV